MVFLLALFCNVTPCLGGSDKQKLLEHSIHSPGHRDSLPAIHQTALKHQKNAVNYLAIIRPSMKSSNLKYTHALNATTTTSTLTRLDSCHPATFFTPWVKLTILRSTSDCRSMPNTHSYSTDTLKAKKTAVTNNEQN